MELFTITPFFLQYIPILGILASVGVFTLYTKFKTNLPLVAKAVVACSIALQIILIPVALQKSSLSDFFLPYTWAKDVAKVLKPKSFFFAFGDNPAFLNFYVLGVERLRDDIFFLDTTPGSNIFRVTLTPYWKFYRWYPEFYASPSTSAAYFYPVARKGKLYASSIRSIPESIKEKFDTGLYVLIVILKPKDYPFSITERFKSDFQKIDYLPIVYSHKADVLSQEILHRYTTTILNYAELLGEENSQDTDHFYKLALFNAPGNSKDMILKNYLGFLAAKRHPLEGEKFIRELNEAETDIKTKKMLEDIENWYRKEHMK
jgi:hypothetical protein